MDKKHLDTLKNLPTLLAEKGEEAKLRDLLTDFEFLRLKVETFGPYPLLEDYNLVPNKDEQLELFHKVLVAESHILNEKPFLLFQQLYNKLVWNADDKLRRRLHEAAQKYSRAWLKRLNLPDTKTPAQSTLVNDECANISALQWHCAGLVAAGYEDGTLRLWNSGQMLYRFELDKSKVLAVGFNFCGSKLCAFTAESLFAVFDITSGKLLQTRRLKASICAAFSLPTPDEDILPSLAFYTTQKELVVVHNDGDLHIIPQEIGGEIRAITFLGDQDKLVLAGITEQQSHQYTGAGSYSPASLIKVINLEGIEDVVNTESQHGFNSCCHGYIDSVSSTPDGKCFATASHIFAMDEYSEYEAVYLGQAAVWQKKKGVWEPSFRASRGVGIFAIAFCSDQQQTVGIEWGEGLTLWDNEGKRIETKKFTSNSDCCSLIVTSENKPTVLVGVSSAIHCFALDDIANPIPATFHRHDGEVKTADISPDLSLIATGSVDFKIAIQEVRPGEMAHLLWEDAHTERVNSVVFSPDGQRVYSGGYDWIINCWSARTGTKLGEFSDSGFGRIATLEMAPAGDMLFATSVGGYRFVVLDRDLVPLLSMGFESICTQAFSPKNHLLALAVGGDIALIDIPKLLEMSPKYTDYEFINEDQKILSAIRRIYKIRDVSAMCFSHQSDMLAIGNPSSVSLLQGEQILQTWKSNGVRALAFSKDDRFLACGTYSGIAIVSLKSGKEISWVPTNSPVISLRFSFDGKKLAAVDNGSSFGDQPEIYLFQFEEPKTE